MPASMQNTSRPDDTRDQQGVIAAELTHLLFTQATPAIVGSFLVATCLVFLFRNTLPLHVLYNWYLLILCVTVARYALVKAYQYQKPEQQHAALWYRLFILITACSALSWLPLSTFLLPQDLTQQVIIAVALAAITATAVPYFSASRLACATFITPLLLPFGVKLILANSLPQTSLGVLALLYLSILLIASFRTYASVRNTLFLHFENKTLIEKLTTEKNEHKKTAELVANNREKYIAIMDAVPGLVAFVDNELRYQFTNKAFETWFNKPTSEIRGKLIQETLNSADYETLLAHRPTTADTTTYETVMRFHHEKERYVSVTLIPNLQNNAIQGFYLLISDVTPRINYLATHDTLTSLPNRSLFIARFARALKFAQAHNKSVGLLFLDLDYFKNINDTLGHDLGDQLLIKVSERLQNCLRRDDTLARQGGDEFTVIFEAIDEIEDVIKVAQKICKSFYDPFNVNGREVFITTSIGISIYPHDGQELQTLLKNADIAMYRAKERGRNTFEFFTHEMNEQMVQKLALESNLRSALEKQQFHIYYQPLIDIRTGQIESVEGLLRWYVPNAGIIMPSEFIPLAEQTGLIVPIGEWVLRTVCAQGYQWQKEGIKPLKLCVNLSGNQFKDYRSLLEKISSILNETKIAGKYLTVEITESSIMDDIEYSITTIEALKELGVTIALDDFGTGYSSLSYLNRLPIDIVKIDRTFIADLTTHEGSAKIVTAVINMAHNLKLTVVAEGVETFEQYSLLKFLGCDQIQGYLIHPPLRVEEISSILNGAFSFEEHIKLRQLHQLTKDIDNKTSSEPIR